MTLSIMSNNKRKEFLQDCAYTLHEVVVPTVILCGILTLTVFVMVNYDGSTDNCRSARGGGMLSRALCMDLSAPIGSGGP